MKFQFRLEKVLHFVRLKETVKKLEVSAVIQKIQFLERRLEEIKKNLTNLLEKYQEGANPDFVYYQTNQIVIESKSIEHTEKQISEQKLELAMRREELSKIAMRKKGLESLKEKRHQEFRTNESRKQQKELDEIYQLNQQVK